jgi:hypothetical protein
MSKEEYLHDVSVREQQLEAHILRSPEYRRRADQEMKRQVTMLYLAIALLIVFQGLFTFRAEGEPLAGAVVLITVTSLLAIVNCLLLIKTKTYFRRLNERWIGPHERGALNALRSQRSEILTRLPHTSAEIQNAELN